MNKEQNIGNTIGAIIAIALLAGLLYLVRLLQISWWQLLLAIVSALLSIGVMLGIVLLIAWLVWDRRHPL